MIEKTKVVFYCEFCKRHGLSRPAMEKHERHCTLNPGRSCRWRWRGDHPDVDPARLAAELRGRFYAPPSDGLEAEDVDWLREQVEGCPACMLAAFRQSEVQYHCDAVGRGIWDYDAEVIAIRAAERDEERQREDDYRTAMQGA